MPLIRILFLFIFLVMSHPAFAAIVYLKDGNKVKGEIIEKGSYYVTLRVNGFPTKYFNSQIDRIEEDPLIKLDAPLTVSSLSFDNVSPSKVSLIIQFIEISGSRKNMELNLNAILSKFPEENRSEAAEAFDINNIIEMLIPVYDTYYTEGDLKDIIKFYESPAGQKLVRVTPQVVEDTIRVSVKYFKEKMKE